MKQVIIVRKDLKLPKGKLAAQAAHAAVAAAELARKKCPEKWKKWKQEGMAKIVVYVADETELFELKERIPDKIPKAVITDAGRTVVELGTVTCMGIGPWDEEELDKYTGELKLV